MKRVTNIYIFLLLTLSIQVHPESLGEDDVDLLHNDINRMFIAFEAGKVGPLLRKTHPSIYVLVGGKDKLEELTVAAVSQLREQGISFLSSELGDPTELYSAGKEEVCFIPRISLMEMQGSKVKSIGFLVAIREKGGSEWLYLDGSGIRKDQSLLWKLLPDLEKNISLPPNYFEML